jgi:hypothetical protein
MGFLLNKIDYGQDCEIVKEIFGGYLKRFEICSAKLITWRYYEGKQ